MKEKEDRNIDYADLLLEEFQFFELISQKLRKERLMWLQLIIFNKMNFIEDIDDEMKSLKKRTLEILKSMRLSQTYEEE